MANFVKYNLPKLEQVTTDTCRYYVTPDGTKYPSVTTVLGSIPNPHLDSWREAVGIEEANRVGKAAAERGTFIHTCCENYLLDKPNKFSFLEQTEQYMFKNLVPHINTFQEVHALEDRLFSRKLKVAGTVDTIALIDGLMYIIDYKTSSRLKSKEEISSYFMQTSVYAIAFYEMTGVMVPNIRILMSTTCDGVLVFDEKVSNWVSKFQQIRNNFVL